MIVTFVIEKKEDKTINVDGKNCIITILLVEKNILLVKMIIIIKKSYIF